MEHVQKFLGQIGVQRLLIMGTVGAAVLIGLVLMVVATRGGPMAYLYTDLDPAGARAVIDRLSGESVPYTLSADGTAVMVAQGKVADLRMRLAGEQIGGRLGYEIMDREDAFGTSAAKAKINHTRAIEGELSRSIESITAVRRARVHIVIPQRALFTTDRQPATASVTLRTGGRLSAGQVDAIRYLISSAVPGLAPEHISIVDHTGALLARAGERAASGSSAIEERQLALQSRLREQIETMIGRVVGTGKVRAEVAADVDFDQVRQESETFDPDLQVVARTTTVEREDQNNEANVEGGFVSVSNALPENAAPETGRDTRSSRGSETSEETLYANSSTKTTLVRHGGQVKRLTVSVMVDGIYAEGPGGALQYSPRPQAELDRIARLVENAIGFDEVRGDSVLVENMRFAVPESDVATVAGVPLGIEKDDLLPLARTVILGLLGVAALMLVLRALGKSANGGGLQLPAPARRAGPGPDPARLADLVERASQGDEEAMIELRAIRSDLDTAAIEQDIDVAQVEGRLKSSTLRKVGDVVEHRPGEATAIIRQWMYS